MDTFFNPRSVVIFGVSNKPDNLARGVLFNLRIAGFTGRIHAVGLEQGECMGIPIHTSLDRIDHEIDVAVILTPSRVAPDVFRECARKGIKRIIVESSGFTEYKDELVLIEKEVLDIARLNDIRFIGPNCIGTINIPGKVFLPFVPQKKLPSSGPLGIISQSGGITVWYAHICSREGIGLNKAISVGNKLDVDEEDILEYFLQNPEVGSCLLYLESVINGRRLMGMCRTSKKPVVVFKSNSFPESADIAKSHTAAIAGDDRVMSAAFRQAGIWRVRDANMLAHALKALQLKPMKGNRLMIISRSGGHAVMSADRAALRGFEMVRPPKSFFEKINAIAPETRIFRQNPLDIGDVFNLNVYERILEEGLRVPGIDGLAFIHLLTPLEENDQTLPIMSKIVKLAEESPIPVAIGYLVQGQDIAPIKQALGYPLFETPDEAIDALAVSRDHYSMKRTAMRKRRLEKVDGNGKTASSILEKAGIGLVPGPLANKLLKAYRIPVPDFALAVSAAEAVAAAKKIGLPVAMKVEAKEVVHKTETGAVRLDLNSAAEVRKACSEITRSVRRALPDAEIQGVLVQKMAGPGPEVIVGGRRDPTFGPILVLGMGGIFVEIMDKVSIRVLPVDRRDVLGMMEELPGIGILKGARGEKPVSLDSLADVMLRVAALLMDHEAIQEIDLNPVRLYHRRVTALDARIIL